MSCRIHAINERDSLPLAYGRHHNELNEDIEPLEVCNLDAI